MAGARIYTLREIWGAARKPGYPLTPKGVHWAGHNFLDAIPGGMNFMNAWLGRWDHLPMKYKGRHAKPRTVKPRQPRRMFR